MGTVLVLTAARMLEIEAESIVSGVVDAGTGHLMLTTFGGTTYDAGKVTAANLADASTSVKGILFLANSGEAVAGLDDSKAVTPKDLSDVIAHVFSDVPGHTASTAGQGLVELATNTETLTGTDATRAITPAGLASLPGYKYTQTVLFTSSGTFTKATYPNAKAFKIIAIGGGGGGGGGGGVTSRGGGGGGGGGRSEILIIDINGMASSIPVIIGAGGTAGANTSDTAGDGGSSSFGSTVIANGGSHGTLGSGTNATAGGLGASVSGAAGTILYPGDSGQNGQAAADRGGNGAVTSYGGGGRGSVGSAVAASAGAGYGTGGGGGSTTTATSAIGAAAAGAQGLVIVEVYS